MFFIAWILAGLVLGWYGIEIIVALIGGDAGGIVKFVFALIGALIAYTALSGGGG